MLNNILMGVQIVLSVLLLLVIMPQEGKGNFSSDFSGAGDDFDFLYNDIMHKSYILFGGKNFIYRFWNGKYPQFSFRSISF